MGGDWEDEVAINYQFNQKYLHFLTEFSYDFILKTD